ncbi:hypothetical protein ACFQT0_06520 [Hymenobacter humi]|uniref:GAF domain-containing protein n=1 Tax=Hymenobacter humi TaxID=1411620 RepID=A0ABW2U199_9BACT
MREGFAGIPQAFRSLLQLPLRGLHYDYGMLHLLKAEPHTFDREDLSILQTFTSQAVLSIENLEPGAHVAGKPAHPGRAENRLSGAG